MITFAKAYVVGEKVYSTLEQAQTAELAAILSELITDNLSAETAARHLTENRERVLDILTTTDKSRPRARKVNGGRKPRNVTKLTQTEMAAE